MRPIDTQHEAILASSRRYAHLRVRIEDSEGSLIDITDFLGNDWLIGADWGSDIDSMASDANISINRAIFEDSMAPLMTKSRLNLDSSLTYARFLDLNREVKIDVRYGADETSTPADYILLFRGRIDTIDWGTAEITVKCRDFYGSLQDTWIETEVAYSDKVAGVPVEDAIQDILDDNLSPSPTLQVPSSPGWQVLLFKSTRQSIADEIELLVNQIGWVARYIWDGVSDFKLTFYEPARSKASVDRTFSAADYYSIDECSVDISMIRNAVSVTYRDSADLRTNGKPKHKTVTVTDATSISLYHRRWMSVTEEGSSIIDTASEATQFANAMLSDLKTPKISKSVAMPFFAFVELEDLYQFDANSVHASVDTTFAVVGFRHSARGDQFRTQLSLREDVVAGRSLSWFQWAAGPGQAPVSRVDTSDLTSLTAVEASGSVKLDWEWDNAYMDDELRDPVATTYHEIYVTEHGGTPDTTTYTNLVGTTRGTSFTITTTQDSIVPVDTDLDYHVRAVSKYSESAFQKVSNKRALRFGTAGIGTNSHVFNDGISFNFNEQSKGTEYEPDGWVLETGTWNSDALMDDGTVFGGGLTTRYGSQFIVLK